MSLQVEGAPLHLPLRDGSGGSMGPEIETRTRTRVEPDPHTRRVCGTRAGPYQHRTSSCLRQTLQRPSHVKYNIPRDDDE